jgi:hypothetical protein
MQFITEFALHFLDHLVRKKHFIKKPQELKTCALNLDASAITGYEQSPYSDQFRKRSSLLKKTLSFLI